MQSEHVQEDLHLQIRGLPHEAEIEQLETLANVSALPRMYMCRKHPPLSNINNITFMHVA